MTKDSGNIRDVLTNLYSNSTANRYIAATVLALVVVFSYTGYDTLVYRHDVIQNFSEDNEWLVTFETTSDTMQQTVVLQDEETRDLTFDMADFSVPEGYRIGYIEAQIAGEETAGVLSGNQCDSIAGDIVRNELTAQWDDPSNNLSGQDSSCIPITLQLSIYPEFDGEDRTVSSINEFQALMGWTDDGWGKGILLLTLELDTNSNTPFVGVDDDEEITIDINVVMFRASVEAI
ncbi:MAG: hypothetical protein CMB70_04020 [Euryarchaeota archaeon]|nr:hypothetical protein [Euryarchaeota archaeon]MBJ14517.1 hypothetical protein [Euryarchaeota archaeon]|tara:strand:- start:52 stop:750 length:699 start_codon:yes stop_codon:yes gene_type:complete